VRNNPLLAALARERLKQIRELNGGALPARRGRRSAAVSSGSELPLPDPHPDKGGKS
jgi:hypothetical protein